MRCPVCNGRIRPEGRFCPLCGAQIFGVGAVGSLPPDAVPRAPAPPPVPPPPAPQPFPTSPQPRPVAPLTTIPTRPGSEYAGKTCPYCQFVIKPGDTVVLCPHCEIPHHEDCWTDNRGCTTFGCAGAEVLAHEPAPSTVGARPLGPPSPAAPYLPGPPGQYVPPQPAPVPGGPYVGPGVQQRLARLRNQAGWSLGLGIFGIFCCPIFVAPLIGLVLGIVALRGYNELRIAHDPGRGQAIAGIVCASVALAAGIFLFIAEATGSFSY